MRRGSLVMAILFTAACGGGGTSGDGGDGNDAGAGVGLDTPEGLVEALAIAGCQRGVRCGDVGASEEMQCEQDVTANAAKFPRPYTYDEAVMAKRLAYDAAKAKACVDAVTSSGCSGDEKNAADEKCVGVLTGLVPNGGACKDNSECMAGYCDLGNNGPGCMGTCKPFVAAGMKCDPSGVACVDHYYCDDATMTCLALHKSGDKCAPGTCESGLHCLNYQAAMPAADGGAPDSGVPEKLGTCGLAALGQPCSNFLDGSTNCMAGLYCDDASDNPICATPVAAGKACESPGACANGLSCTGLTYDSQTFAVTKQGTCSPWADVSKPCDPTANGGNGCPYDTNCDMTSKTCTAAGVAGYDCSNDGYCRDGLYCDGTGKCSPAVPFGAACTPPTGNDPDPCHDGTCDMTAKKCTLVCM